MKTLTNSDGRFYLRPTDKVWVPSVTTVLGKYKSPALINWQNRVGQEEADKVRNVATARGTTLHSLCEKYLKFGSNNDLHGTMGDIFFSGLDLLDKEAFLQIKPYLDKIERVKYTEAPLYSKAFKVAGRVDCIGYYEDSLSIIDFKTSKQKKEESWITNYFEQESLYDMMFYELTGTLAKKIVTIVVSLHDAEVQVFVKNPKEYIDSALKKVVNFNEKE